MFDKLIAKLKTLGQVIKAKSGNGVNIYEPKSFDMAELEQLAKDVGFVAVFNPKPSMWEGELIPPRLFVGKSSSLDEEGMADVFQQISQ